MLQRPDGVPPPRIRDPPLQPSSVNTGTEDNDIKVMKGIMRLLSAQERGGHGLDCLVVDDPYVLKLLKSTARGTHQCHAKKLLLKPIERVGKNSIEHPH